MKQIWFIIQFFLTSPRDTKFLRWSKYQTGYKTSVWNYPLSGITQCLELTYQCPELTNVRNYPLSRITQCLELTNVRHYLMTRITQWQELLDVRNYPLFGITHIFHTSLPAHEFSGRSWSAKNPCLSRLMIPASGLMAVSADLFLVRGFWSLCKLSNFPIFSS